MIPITNTKKTDYTKEDFLTTTEPFENVYAFRENPFIHEQKLEEMRTKASVVGIQNFKKLYAEYVRSLKMSSHEMFSGNVTEFSGQPIELSTGKWEANDYGIVRKNSLFEEVACVHPILPMERLVNIDTGVEKLKIAYSKGRKWRTLIADKKTLASTTGILNLADMGVAVNSENAKSLIKYLHDVENENYEILPELKSVSRVGYIPEEGFAPYVENLIFDGDANFKSIFDSITQVGDYAQWVQIATECRKMSTTAKVILAASFASVLVEPVGTLPFFVHLWGGESGTGKSVALMLAASVWADPSIGAYIKTFNATSIGTEEMAGFLNSLPLCLDELQLAKDSRGRINFNVYKLAQGVGRTKSKKDGGVVRTPTWHNSILTTGESPIVSTSDGAGAVNRVLDIECSPNEKVIQDGMRVANTLKQNYGYAGRHFVEILSEEECHLEEATELYKHYFKVLSESDTTEKQAMAAALVCTADELATRWIFKDGNNLTLEEISSFLQSKASVSSGERGYQYLCDWIALNSNRLTGNADTGEIYGIIDGDWAYIVRSVFNKVLEEEGFSSKALLSWMKQKNLIQTRGRNNTRGKRINGVNVECVVVKMPSEEEPLEDIPF